MLGTAKSAARDVTQHAKDAASEVADDARQTRQRRAGPGQDAAQDVASDDAPTVATPKASARRLTAAANRAGASIIG